MSSQKRLIVNADDFGLHTSINSAIEKAHNEGIVTSASLMPGSVLAPAFDDALEVIKRCPNLDIGLHFTLAGAPGLPPDHKAFILAKLAGRFPVSRVTTMLRKQLDVVLQNGVEISHIDSHQHLHALPSVMKVVAKVASEYGIRAVRMPEERGDYGGASPDRIRAAKVLAFLCLVGKGQLIRAGIQFPDYFAGMAISGNLTPSAMIRMLKQVPEGTSEILCHPGSNDNVLARAFNWQFNWQNELEAVTDESVIAAREKLKITPISFKDLVLVA